MRILPGLAGISASLLVIGLAAVPAVRAAAAATEPSTLYVVVNGAGCNDNGPGTQAEPFCTIQEAANVVDPGQTVDISNGSGQIITTPITITRSGTPAEPITFTYETGIQPVLDPTTAPAITFKDVHDVSVSSFEIDSQGSTDAIDVVGSSDISLENLYIEHSSSGAAAADVNIDGASSGVTVSRTRFDGTALYAVLANPGAQQVTVTTNTIEARGGTGITLDGTTDAVVTSNTVIAVCAGITTLAPSAVTLADGSSGTVENNILESASSASCPSPAAGLSVDASSASGVITGYNALWTSGTANYYSWAGTSYATVAAFQSAVPRQGTNDVSLPSDIVVTVPPEGSPAIDSANCSAPGELSTDLEGNPPVADPLATDADLANGDCHASRGAFDRQDTISIAYTQSPVLSTGYDAGTVPFTSGVTITSTATSSAWDEPVSYTVNFGDGSTPVEATPGTEATHVYTTPGKYTVTITATDTSDSSTAETYAAYALTDQSQTPSLTVTPYGYGSTPGILPDTASVAVSYGAYSWEFSSVVVSSASGTDNGSTTPNANGQASWTITYPAAGTYTVTLTATDQSGRVTTAKATITVGDELQDVYPVDIYSGSVAAHGVVKIALSRLILGDCCANAALVNVGVTHPTQSGGVIVYPDGTSRPSTAAAQFAGGKAAQNSVLATGNTVDFYNNSSGSIDLAVVTYGIDDISTAESGVYGDTYTPITPTRVLGGTKLSAHHTVTFQLAGRDGIPADASAVLLNVTASAETTPGGFVTYSANESLFPVNGGYWAKGQQVTNLVMMAVDGNAVIDNTSSGSASFTADAVGYYTYDASSSVFLPATPRRLLNVKINGRQTVKLTVVGGAVPTTGTTAVAVNLTASGATATNTITAYADGTARPGITSLSYDAGITTENATVIAVGSDGAIDLDNNGTTPVTVAVDLTGSYYAY